METRERFSRDHSTNDCRVASPSYRRTWKAKQADEMSSGLFNAQNVLIAIAQSAPCEALEMFLHSLELYVTGDQLLNISMFLAFKFIRFRSPLTISLKTLWVARSTRTIAKMSQMLRTDPNIVM